MDVSLTTLEHRVQKQGTPPLGRGGVFLINLASGKLEKLAEIS